MTPLQAKFLILGIGLLTVKLCFLLTVLIIARQIQRRAKALKQKQQANQAAAHSVSVSNELGSTVPGPTVNP